MDFLAQARRQMLAGQLADSRERLMASIQGLGVEDMLEPGAAGEWSVRDQVAHIAAWDRVATAGFRDMVSGVRPAFLDLDDDGVQAFNDEHHHASSGLNVPEALEEMHAAREEMLQFLRGVDNQALFAPAPGDQHADLSIASCLQLQASHDDEHSEMIETWREGRPD